MHLTLRPIFNAGGGQGMGEIVIEAREDVHRRDDQAAVRTSWAVSALSPSPPLSSAPEALLEARGLLAGLTLLAILSTSPAAAPHCPVRRKPRPSRALTARRAVHRAAHRVARLPYKIAAPPAMRLHLPRDCGTPTVVRSWSCVRARAPSSIWEACFRTVAVARSHTHRSRWRCGASRPRRRARWYRSACDQSPQCARSS